MRQQQHKSWHALTSYTTRHLQAALNSIGQLSRAPFTSLVTCLVIGIALALPMALFVLLKNMETLSHNFQQSTQMTLYLKQDVKESQADSLVSNLKKNPEILSVTAISPQKGLQELQQQAGIDNVLSDLQNNPIPWAIVIVPAKSFQSSDKLADLSQALKQNPEVDSVQMDALWVERLFTLMTLAHRGIYALTLFLGIGVMLIVNNCIRSAIQNNKKEIDVIKLIGGTHSFIRRPFLYAGMIYGLLGGIIAWQLVDLMLVWLGQPVSHLANLYHSQFSLAGISFADTLLLLVSSIALGLLGSWLTVTRFLRTSRVQ